MNFLLFGMTAWRSSPWWKLPEPASLTLFLLTVDSCRGQQSNQFVGYPPRRARSVLNSLLSGNLIFYSDLLTSQILRLALKSKSPLQFDSPQHLLSTFTPCLTRALPSHTDILGAGLQLVNYNHNSTAIMCLFSPNIQN